MTKNILNLSEFRTKIIIKMKREEIFQEFLKKLEKDRKHYEKLEEL